MADYIGWVITNKGRELLAKVINHETKLNITKLEIGSGYNTGNDRELTALINSKNHFLVNSYERKDNATVEFTFVVSNRATNGEALNREAYQIKEMGIFASDDAGVEVLYAYNKGTNGDYLPVFNGKNQIDIIEKCIITIDQQADMNVNIDNSVTYVTYEGLRRELDKKISKTDLATETEAGLVTLNQIKGLIPTIPEASESQAGVVTLAKIKEISPRPDLSNYVTFNKGYRENDNVNWFLRSNLSETWMPHQALMFNESGNYTGTFHLNGSRAYYKVPNRNSNNWCEIMDNFDRDNLQNQINAHVNGYQFNKNGIGYCKFPNGFMIQWGWGTTNTPTNFPIAFPNVCLRIIATQKGYSEIYENIKVMDGWTNYNFRIKLLDDQIFAFHYIAIGF